LKLQESKLHKYVEDCLKANGWKDCFIVEIITSPSGKIEVYLEKYTLEVSSPGLTRPLKFLRQYTKNIGRKVVIKTSEKTYKGVMKEVNESFVIIEKSASEKKGSKKKIIIENKIEMEKILETKIAVSF